MHPLFPVNVTIATKIYDIPFDNDEDSDGSPIFEDDSSDNINSDLTSQKLLKAALYLKLLVSLLGSPTLLSDDKRNSLDNKILMNDVKKMEWLPHALGSTIESWTPTSCH